MFNTPIALIFFNRADTLEKVFHEIRSLQPTKLFLIRDGARKNNEEDEKNIAKCEKIVETVDWKCDVRKDYSEENLGCGKRVSSGLDWVFGQVDRAIILEDDCLPAASFFSFCEELLERYKDDRRILSISGRNRIGIYNDLPFSYCFSMQPGIGGWATWKRAWKYFDYKVELWENRYYKKQIKKKLRPLSEYLNKSILWGKASRGNIAKRSFWGLQWNFVFYANHGLGVVPRCNLIENIGYTKGATHYRKKIFSSENRLSLLTRHRIEFPLIHPPGIIRDYDYDRLSMKILFPRSAIGKLMVKWIFFIVLKK
jgi:hypothetical protein